MEDPSSHKDISGLPFSIRFVASKFGGLQYGIESCFLQTTSDGDSEQENIYEVSMHQINPEYPSSIYEGKSTFRAGTALSKYKVYCPLIAPNVEVEDFTLFVTLRIENKTFESNNPNCKISPYKGIAKKVEVETNISDENDFVIKITDLRRVLFNSHLFVGFTTHSGSLPDVTLGTTNDYQFLTPSGEVECTVNGKVGVVKARAYHGFVDVSIQTLLGSGKDYVISCPDMTASITNGSKYLPSIISVVDEKTHNYSMAVNTYH